MFEIIDQEPQDGAIIKVMGVGGCGGNAVEHMLRRGLAGVDFICANTDAQALKRSTARIQIQLGSTLTRGLGAGAKPEMWILGSSTFGAQLAAALGLPFAFASHFAPDSLDMALHLYRRDFRPSAQLDRPYAMAGFNVFAAETDAAVKGAARDAVYALETLVRVVAARGLDR